MGGFPSGCGAIAQLGERVNGIHEVAGSIPAGSTKFLNRLAEPSRAFSGADRRRRRRPDGPLYDRLRHGSDPLPSAYDL